MILHSLKRKTLQSDVWFLFSGQKRCLIKHCGSVFLHLTLIIIRCPTCLTSTCCFEWLTLTTIKPTCLSNLPSAHLKASLADFPEGQLWDLNPEPSCLSHVNLAVMLILNLPAHKSNITKVRLGLGVGFEPWSPEPPARKSWLQPRCLYQSFGSSRLAKRYLKCEEKF